MKYHPRATFKRLRIECIRYSAVFLFLAITFWRHMCERNTYEIHQNEVGKFLLKCEKPWERISRLITVHKSIHMTSYRALFFPPSETKMRYAFYLRPFPRVISRIEFYSFSFHVRIAIRLWLVRASKYAYKLVYIFPPSSFVPRSETRWD